jgi:hypothetical protein
LQEVICLVAELSEQLKQHFAAMDVKLARLQTLLAASPPLDPPSSRAEWPH